jgi:hypothetical protein
MRGAMTDREDTLEKLTCRVHVAKWTGEPLVEARCDSDGPLTVAWLEEGDQLSITHRRTGYSAGQGARFPVSVEGLAVAQAFRDELLALPLDWSHENPSPKVIGERLADIHRRCRNRAVEMDGGE